MTEDDDQLAGIGKEAGEAVAGADYARVLELLRPVVDGWSNNDNDPRLLQFLLWLGAACFETRQLALAEGYLRRGAAVLERERTHNGLPFLHELSLVAMAQGDVAGSASLCAEAIESAIETAYVEAQVGLTSHLSFDMMQILPSLVHLAVLTQMQGRPKDAIAILDVLYASCCRSHQPTQAAKVLNELGLAYFQAGQRAVGVRHLGQSAVMKARVGDLNGLAATMVNLRGCLGMDPSLALENQALSALAGLPADPEGDVDGSGEGGPSTPAITDGRTRAALEDSLCQQIGHLSDRLVAGVLLGSSKLPEALIEQHDGVHQRADGSSGSPISWTRSVAQIATELAQGALRPLFPRDLPSVRIQLEDRSLPLWNDIEINRQLRHARSSLRFIFPGAHALSVAHVMSLVGRRLEPTGPDPRFILGQVSDVTAGPFGPVYDILEEIAVSPWCDPRAPGFFFEDNVVVRRRLIRRLARSQAETDDIAEIERGLWLYALVHELIHAASHRDPSIGSYLGTDWLDDLVCDIVRFVEVPRTRADIGAAIDSTVHNLVVSQLRTQFPDVFKASVLPSLDQVIDGMLKQGALLETTGGMISLGRLQEEFI